MSGANWQCNAEILLLWEKGYDTHSIADQVGVEPDYVDRFIDKYLNMMFMNDDDYGLWF